MFKKDKKNPIVDFIVKPKPKESHKKRNTLIGLGSATAVFVLAGIKAKKDDRA